ncbi:hypothetical protein [Enterobacter hormaechei]
MLDTCQVIAEAPQGSIAAYVISKAGQKPTNRRS